MTTPYQMSCRFKMCATYLYAPPKLTTYRAQILRFTFRCYESLRVLVACTFRFLCDICCIRFAADLLISIFGHNLFDWIDGTSAGISTSLFLGEFFSFFSGQLCTHLFKLYTDETKSCILHCYRKICFSSTIYFVSFDICRQPSLPRCCSLDRVVVC